MPNQGTLSSFTEGELATLSKYSIQTVYDRLRGEKMDVMWDKVAWKSLSIPKHRFIISWLALQSKLNTAEKLFRIGVATSDKCKICDVTLETHSHLFFEWYFSTQCLTEIKRWLGIQTSALVDSYE